MTHSPAKNLKPGECAICGDIFLPFTSRQHTCGKETCKKEWNKQQNREYYHRVKGSKKYIHSELPPEKHRVFQVTYFQEKDMWFWKAVGDNGCKLENGPFSSQERAEKDFKLAIRGE